MLFLWETKHVGCQYNLCTCEKNLKCMLNDWIKSVAVIYNEDSLFYLKENKM